jgi:hypothetical protein
LAILHCHLLAVRIRFYYYSCSRSSPLVPTEAVPALRSYCFHFRIRVFPPRGRPASRRRDTPPMLLAPRHRRQPRLQRRGSVCKAAPRDQKPAPARILLPSHAVVQQPRAQGGQRVTKAVPAPHILPRSHFPPHRRPASAADGRRPNSRLHPSPPSPTSPPGKDSACVSPTTSTVALLAPASNPPPTRHQPCCSHPVAVQPRPQRRGSVRKAAP